MSKFAATLSSNLDFHVTYQDFIDDLYSTYIFNPVGYSIPDTFFYMPYVHTELKRSNSLLRHMMSSGLIKGHFRHFQHFDASAAFARSQDSVDARTRSFFQTARSSLSTMGVGAYLDTDKAIEIANMLDDIKLSPNFLVPWKRGLDGSIIDTGQRLHELVAAVLDPKFQTVVAHRLEDERTLPTVLAELSSVQEFVADLLEEQSQFHEGGGLRVNSFVKAIAKRHGISESTINSSAALIASLTQEGRNDTAQLAMKALRVLVDRHTKNMSEFFGVGYSNPKSDGLTFLLAVGDGLAAHARVGESVSVRIEMPDLRPIEKMAVRDLDHFLKECGIIDYHQRFLAWNRDPVLPNALELIKSLKRVEQLIKKRYAGATKQQFVVRLSSHLQAFWNRAVVFWIEANTSVARAAANAVDDLSPNTKNLIRAGVGAVTGDPMKATADVVLGMQPTLAERYDQYVLSREEKPVRPRLISLTRNMAAPRRR